MSSANGVVPGEFPAVCGIHSLSVSNDSQKIFILISPWLFVDLDAGPFSHDRQLTTASIISTVQISVIDAVLRILLVFSFISFFSFFVLELREQICIYSVCWRWK